MGEFAEGVYESLETAGLTRQLRSLPLDARFETVDPADAPEVLPGTSPTWCGGLSTAGRVVASVGVGPPVATGRVDGFIRVASR